MVTETEEKRKAGNAKLENLIPNSRRPQLCTDKTPPPSLVSWARPYRTTALPTDPELLYCTSREILLSTALKRTKTPQPESSSFSANTGGKALMSGRNPGSGSGTASISQNSQARQSPGQKSDLPGRGLQSLRYLSHRGEHKKPKLREDPVSLNNVAATQDKGTALPLKLL